MSYVVETMTNLAAQTGFAFLKPGNFIMILVALVFLYLAIAKGYEPLLLVPISFGMLLVNLYPSIMELRRSLVFTARISLQCLWDLTERQQQRFPLSVERMVRPLSSLPESLDRQT